MDLLATTRSVECAKTITGTREENDGDVEDGTLCWVVQSLEPRDASPVVAIVGKNVPFGRAKTPLSDPLCSAWLKWLEKEASLIPPRELFAWTYFLRA